MLPRNSKIIRDERAMMSGNMGFSKLLAPSNADVHAVKSGFWSDPSVWSTGAVPKAGQKIHNPMGKMLTYDMDDGRELAWFRNDGGFRFATDGKTRMVCDTILSTLTSYLEIGTPVNPATADIEWVGGALDPADAKQMGRGLLTIGRVMIYGRPTVPYAKLPQKVTVGTTFITLPNQYDTTTGELRFTGEEVAASWRVGDRLYFGRNHNRSGNGADECTIAAIKGASITLSKPLAFDHSGPDADPHGVGAGNTIPPGATFIHRHQSYVLNETRSVTLRSQDPAGVRGHCMFMHGRQIRNTDKHFRREDHIFVPSREEMGPNADPGITVFYISFDHMGRTRTVEAPAIGTPENPVGRYSCHFHKAGHWAQNPILCKGAHVHGNVGWGIVRHDSHVAVDYHTGRGDTGMEPAGTNGGGAMFIDEEDTELGAWTRGLATAVRGSVGKPNINASGDWNNEGAFNGHGHDGDGWAANRQASVRELIGINVRQTLHIHPPKTNTRYNRDSSMTVGFPVDRRPDIEGLKRTTLLTNPVAYFWNEDMQPSGWFGCEAHASAGLRVFHRQRAFHAFDFHTLIANWVTNGGMPIMTENYTHNYMIHHGSFNCEGGKLWKYGPKSWGFVWVGNYAWNLGSPLIDAYGRNDDSQNAAGGFADNEFVNAIWPTYNSDPAKTYLAMDTTNHDSSKWPTYTFSVDFKEEPYGGSTDIIKADITDGFANNIPLLTAAYSGGPVTGPRPMGFGMRGSSDVKRHTTIIAPGGDVNRGVSLTAAQLVSTHGCIAKNGGHVVPLWFPFRDRLTSEIHWARTEYDVSHLPLEYRQKYEMPTDFGPPNFPEIPPLVDDLHYQSYSVMLDPDYPIHYVCIDGKVQADASEAFLDVPVGQTVQWSRTFTQADGSAKTLEFTVPGRAHAPSEIYALPSITMQGKYMKTMHRGADEFAPRHLTFDKGRVNGWPYPYAVDDMKWSQDGKATWPSHPHGIGVHDTFFPRTRTWTNAGGKMPEGPAPQPEGHYKLDVSFENGMGTLNVPSNTLEIITSGKDISGETWDVPKPTVVAEAGSPMSS